METHQTVLNIISDEINVRRIDKDSSLRDLGADSLDITAIAMRLEEQFGCLVSEGEIQDCTVDEISGLIQSKLSKETK
jgi:acyl carrier protein